KRAEVDSAIAYAIKAGSALVIIRRGNEIRIAGINGRAAGQQRVCPCRAAVVLQGTKHRIGVDLIARAIQVTTTVVTAEVVTERHDSTPAIKDNAVSSGADVEDGVVHVNRWTITMKLHCIIAHSAVRDAHFA